MIIFVVEVIYKKHGNSSSVSQIGYKTLEGAMDFIKSRSDYNGQPFTNWCVETPEHLYMIRDIHIAE